MKKRARRAASAPTDADQLNEVPVHDEVPVHVTPNGGRYVLGKDLVRSRGFQEAVKSMKNIEANSRGK